MVYATDTKSGLTTPFLMGTRQMADGRWQMADGKKDFSRKGGYQGGFGRRTAIDAEVGFASCSLLHSIVS